MPVDEFGMIPASPPRHELPRCRMGRTLRQGLTLRARPPKKDGIHGPHRGVEDRLEIVPGYLSRVKVAVR